MEKMKSLLAPIKSRIPQVAAMHGKDKLLYQRLFCGALAGCLATMLLAESPVLNTMELNLLEWRFKVAKEVNLRLFGKPTSEEIVLVTYDDDDQFELEAERIEGGPPPIQGVLAQLITELEKANPLLIVVDLDLTGRADPELVRVFNENRSKLILAIFGEFEETTDFPPSELRNAVAACAYDYLIKENNGLVAQLPINPKGMMTEEEEETLNSPILTYGHEIFDALPKTVAAMMSAKSGVGPSRGQMPQFGKDEQPLYINYSGTKYDTFSTLDVIDNKVPPNKFTGKVVIIGTNFTQKIDNTPNARTPLSNKAIHAQVQADAINTIHKNKIIHTFPQSFLHHLLLLAGGALGAIASVLKMGRRTTTYLVTSMFLVGGTQLLFMFGGINIPIVPLLAVLMLTYVFGTLIYLDTDLRLRNKELAEARQAMQERAEEERQRIAGELHDETLPALSSVARMADRLSGEMSESETPYLMREKLDQAIVEMRRVINDLHPSVLETMGFKPALENLLVALEREMDIETEFIDGDSDSDCEDDYGLSDMSKLQLYRMVQEGLNNIYKHSKADKVDISINLRGDLLFIKVTDNGRGIDLSKIRADSHGLLNIRQRAQLIGAHVEWTKPLKYETGTELNVSIHVAQDQNSQKDDIA